jgi:hypothetical protein
MLSLMVGAACPWRRGRGGACGTPIGSLLLNRGFVPRCVFGGQAVRWQGADRWLKLQRVDSCSSLLHLAGQVIGLPLDVGESPRGVTDVSEGSVLVEPSGADLACVAVRGLGIGGSTSRSGDVASCVL